MRKIILLGLLIILVASCEQSKKYEYVEIGLKENFSGGTGRDEKDGVTIRAKSDSIAYLEAYQKFCIAEKVAKDMKEAIGSSGTTPTEFKLLDNEGNDISLLINFDNIDSLKNDIRTRIFDLKNSLTESVEKNKENELTKIKNSAKIDSSKINELDKYFVSKKDEFDPDGLVWHKPKSAPKYTNQNGIYCYFQSNNGMPSNLRMRLQYEADDWLFLRKYNFQLMIKPMNLYQEIPKLILEMEVEFGNGLINQWGALTQNY